MVILDAMEKTAGIRVLQTELNDQPGVCLKLAGPLADLHAAVEAAQAIAGGMQVPIVVDVIAAPAAGSELAYEAKPDFNPLIRAGHGAASLSRAGEEGEENGGAGKFRSRLD